MIKLTDAEFHEIVTFVKSNYGINLTNKRHLIEARMYSVLVERNLKSFSDYFKIVKDRNSREVLTMLNKLSTNHTYFLRESAHFDFLKNIILPELVRTNKNNEIRIWSAGCSSGEEAFTTVMVIHDFLGMNANKWDYRLLATDISSKVLEQAQNAIYNLENMKNIPPSWIKRYFIKVTDTTYTLSPSVKEQVIFKYFNLMESFPFHRPFDVIFCRNVMIYFDQETKNKLINKFYKALKPGGYLLIGHSETVQRDKTEFKYIQPSVYRKGG